MPLKETDVQAWGEKKCSEETHARMERIKAIKQEHGSIAEITDRGVLDEVKNINADLNYIGARFDEVKEVKGAEERLEEYERGVKDRKRPKFPGRTDDDRDDEDDESKSRKGFRTAGDAWAASDAYKAYKERGRKDIESDVSLSLLMPEYGILEAKGFWAPGMKAVLGEDDSLANVDTEFPPESRRVGIIVTQDLPQPTVAQLIPQTTIDQASVPFMRETVISEGARELEEGELYPEASIDFTEDSSPVRKIGVALPATEEILEDESLVRGHINARLPQFIRNREDLQILRGDGVAPNLLGILNLSGIDTTTQYDISDTAAANAAASGTGSAIKMESIFTAAARVSENFLDPDAVVTSLGFWEMIRLAKDANGNYLIAPATDAAIPRIWGLRIVSSGRMPVEGAGNKPILVGAFAQASQIWRRRAISLSVSDSHEDRFLRDILTIKANTRLAVTHYRPGGYATVTSVA